VKTVLLLGDSIRLSYQPLVAERLEGRARVFGPSDNGRFALYTLMRLGDWLAECGKPDVIYWNNGLWDLGQCPHRFPNQIPISDYAGNLGVLLQRLRETNARIIWRTITPVSAARGWRDNWLFEPKDVDRYNEAAQSLMEKEGIPCHDLGSVIRERMDDCLDVDGVHLSSIGRTACADAVSRTILQYL
jgi:lysophospholipase L1-like esterase